MSAGRVDTLTALVRSLPRPDGATHYVVSQGDRWGGVVASLEVRWFRWRRDQREVCRCNSDWEWQWSAAERAFTRPQEVIAKIHSLDIQK